MQKINIRKLLAVLVAILFLAGVLVFLQSRTFRRLAPILTGGRVIEENLSIPDLKLANGIDGRSLSASPYLTPLVPKSASERIIIPLAKLTLKQGLLLSRTNAGYWSSDAKLIYAKSFGAVTLEGQSSQWLYVFGSETKKSASGIVVRGDKVIAELELAAGEYGHDLPSDWLDAKAPISSLAASPDFAERSIGGLSLYYNEDSGAWSFGVALDKGQSASVPLK